MQARPGVLAVVVLATMLMGNLCAGGLAHSPGIDDFVMLHLNVTGEGWLFDLKPIVGRRPSTACRLTGIVSSINYEGVGSEPPGWPTPEEVSLESEISYLTRVRLVTTGPGGDWGVYKIGPLRPTEREDIAWVLDSGHELPVLWMDCFTSYFVVTQSGDSDAESLGPFGPTQALALIDPTGRPQAVTPPPVQPPPYHTWSGAESISVSGLLYELLRVHGSGGDDPSVPEPATLLLLGLGGVVVLCRRGSRSGGGDT
ncbi:MAG: PEP-CTERM sorting domain-containing protein [Phycisphaerales bacterium]|nr:MAG: PEP-CTERM sorting domain-containing protein [Phycisphaerales bacterium]